MAQAAAHQCDDAQSAAPRPWSHGTFYWNELVTHDSERARKFYADSLGWTFAPMPMADGGTYWLISSGNQMAGGMFPITDPNCADMAEGWLGYIAVDDVDTRVTKALQAGATLMRPIFDIPGVGRIAILREPGGAAIGWMTPATA